MDKKLMLNQMIDHYANGNKAGFGKMLGISKATISNWTYRGSFNAELIYSMIPGISAHWLLSGDGPMTTTEKRKKPASLDEGLRP